ncbi:MAG: hypothetical protein WCW13_02455 [archaeon]|jgi:hypothetical protein
MSNFPKIDLKELDRDIKRNKESRLEFLKQYVQWLKKTPNKKWSKQQNKVIEQN